MLLRTLSDGVVKAVYNWDWFRRFRLITFGFIYYINYFAYKLY